MLMRAVNLLLALLMVAFAAVQYNDPDVLLWAAYYAVPAFWAAAVAWRPAWPMSDVVRAGALWASAAASGALMWAYWPPTPGFWRQEVWWNEESAREGMGLMIAFAAVLVAAASGHVAARRLRTAR